jgi:hypothetical protein
MPIYLVLVTAVGLGWTFSARRDCTTKPFSEQCYDDPTMQLGIRIGIVLSLLSGGLAGGCVSVLFNRIFHWRQVRTKFYPILSNMFSAYVLRMEKPEERYLINIVGDLPSPEDRQFVEHRSSFIDDLIQFNELREARVLRKRLLDNMASGDHTEGKVLKLDLAPESAALNACLVVLHKRSSGGSPRVTPPLRPTTTSSSAQSEITADPDGCKSKALVIQFRFRLRISGKTSMNLPESSSPAIVIGWLAFFATFLDLDFRAMVPQNPHVPTFSRVVGRTSPYS